MAFRSWLLVATLLAGVSSAADWPEFRGPGQQGHATETGLPLTWSESEHVVWKTDIEGLGWSSPAVVDGTVWLTTARDEGRSLRVVALDASTGAIARDVEVLALDDPGPIHGKNSHASPTPVVADGRVYAHFGSHGTVCLSAGGEVVWKTRLAQVTKQGFVYAFDRATGAPIWPIEERPVPASDVPGEEAARTQPFPTRPAPFEAQGVTLNDLADFTPEIRAMAEQAVRGFRLGPLFTPPSTEGTLMRPGTTGGANWSGAAVDPATGLLYVPSRNAFAVTRVAPTDPALNGNLLYMQAPGRNPQMPEGLPLFKPPYSRMTAINMHTGDHVWMVPTGAGDRIRSLPRLQPLKLPEVGGDITLAGPLLTRTLLVYPLTTGGTRGGPRLVAYDKATGEARASVDLPGPAAGTPMTYLAGGKQYIAITVQGQTPRELPELVVYALP